MLRVELACVKAKNATGGGWLRPVLGKRAVRIFHQTRCYVLCIGMWGINRVLAWSGDCAG
jgi:hypothetical protein